MAYEQRDNSGSLFKKDKQGNENRPDYSGPGMVNGEAVEISAWIKTSAQGVKYMSLSFKPPFQKTQAAPAYKAPSQDGAKARQLAPRQAPRPSSGFENMDDDIPFRDPIAYRGAHWIF